MTEEEKVSKKFPDTKPENYRAKLRALRRRRAKNKMRKVSRNKNR